MTGLGPTLPLPARSPTGDCVEPGCTLRLWFPVHTHPSGPARDPWYVVVDGLVWRTAMHPSGTSGTPSFRIDGDDVYALDRQLDRLLSAPCFVIRDAMIFPADTHPLGGSNRPWYEEREHGYDVIRPTIDGAATTDRAPDATQLPVSSQTRRAADGSTDHSR